MLWTGSLHHSVRRSCRIMFKFFPRCTRHPCRPSMLSFFFPSLVTMRNVSNEESYNSIMSGTEQPAGTSWNTGPVLGRGARNRFIILIPRGHILHWGFVWWFCWFVLLQGQRRPQVHTIWTARDLNHCLTSTPSGLSVATKKKKREKRCELVL